MQIGHQIAGADIAPGIFIDLTTEELAAVCAFFTDDLGSFDQRFIVNQRRAAFTARRVVFGFMEAKAANMTNGSQCTPFVSGHHALSSIFHHKQIMLFRQRHNGVHFAGHTRVMDRHDNARFVGDRCFNQRFVDVHGVRANIHKNDFCATQHKGIGSGDKGVARHDHFIARLDIEQQRRHLQRSGAGRRQ